MYQTNVIQTSACHNRWMFTNKWITVPKEKKEFHSAKSKHFANGIPRFSGVSERIRTSGLSLRRRPLYPAELRRHISVLSAYFPGYLTFGSYQHGTGVLNPEKYIFANPSVLGTFFPYAILAMRRTCYSYMHFSVRTPKMKIITIIRQGSFYIEGSCVIHYATRDQYQLF